MGIAEKSKSKSTKKKLRNQEGNLMVLSRTDSAISRNAKDDCGTESGGILQKFSEKKNPVNQRTKVTRKQTRKEKPAETKQKRCYKRKAENYIALQTGPPEVSSESKIERSITSRPLSTSSQEYDSIPSCTMGNMPRKEQSNKRGKSPKRPNRKKSVKTDTEKASDRSIGGTTTKRISGQSRRNYIERNNTLKQAMANEIIEANENEIRTYSEEEPTQKQTGTENLRSQQSTSSVKIATTDTGISSRLESLEKDPGKHKSNLSSAKRKRESSSETSAKRNMEQTSQEYSEVNEDSTDNKTTSENSVSLVHSNARSPKRSSPDKSPEEDTPEDKNAGESVIISERPCKEIRSKSASKNSARSRNVPLSTKQPKKPVKGRSKSEKVKKRPVSKQPKKPVKDRSKSEKIKRRPMSITRRKTTTAKKGIKTRTPRKAGRKIPTLRRYKKA